MYVYYIVYHVTCVGVLSGTAESIFGKMHEVFVSNDICWSKCIGLSVDNTSVNIGKHNSIMARVLQENPAIYINGCPCHIVHNMMQKASVAFTQVKDYYNSITTIHVHVNRW